MITSLFLQNFKAFEEEELEFGLLNVLAGLNNSGKSSIIQALRLLREQKPLPELGPLDVYTRSDTKGFALRCDQQTKHGIVIHDYTNSMNEKMNKIHEHLPGIEGIMSYISADRLGPRNSLPLSIDGDITTVGSRGEYIVDFLTHLEKDWIGLQVPDALVAKEGKGVDTNIREWLRFISPGVDFAYSSDSNTDIGRTMFNNHRPVHVGFGLSYTLPIIASILIHASQLEAGKAESVLLLLENPEAHLHPSGQTKMGEMLAKAASCGVQIVVETHSDHLLNGIRIAIKEKMIPHTDVKCFYFKAGSWDGTNEASSTVDRIEIDKYGMVDFWPEGFFDETERSLQRLI
jgi:predicted ATPase